MDKVQWWSMNLESISLWNRIFKWKSVCTEIQKEFDSIRFQKEAHEARAEHHKEQAEAHMAELEKAKAGNRTALKFIMQTNGLKLKLVILFLSITLPCMGAFPPQYIHNNLDTNSVGVAPADGWFLVSTSSIPKWSLNGGSLTNITGVAVAQGTNILTTTNGQVVTVNGLTDTNVVNILTAVTSNGITPRIIKSLGITVDGGGAVLTAGTKGYIEVPYDCTIISASLMADQSGSIAIETWRTNGVVASFPPTRAGVLFTNYLTTASKSTDFALANNTSLSLQTTNVLGFNIITNALSITRVTLQLRVQP